jgi:hypothetical protein
VELTDVSEQLGEMRAVLRGEHIEIPDQRTAADMFERPVVHDANSFGDE